jgi:hypothetical protein
MEPVSPSSLAELPPARPKQPGVVFLIAAAHCVLLLVLFLGLRLGNIAQQTLGAQIFRLGWIGLVCGQLSLAAIFGAVAPLPLLIRLPFGLIAGAVAWALLLVALPVSTNSSAGWAAMAGVQFSLVALAAYCLRVLIRQAEGDSPAAWLGQYSIATLLAWTTLIAIILGLLRWVFHAFGWDESVLRWEWFLHLLVIGAFNAAIGIFGLASVIGSRWPKLRQTWGLIVAIVVVFHEPFFLDTIFRSVGADYVDLWLIGGMQIAATFITLQIIRRFGGLDEK